MVRAIAWSLAVTVLAFAGNIAVFLRAYKATALPYLSEPQLSENLPRLWVATVSFAAVALLTGLAVFWLLRRSALRS